MRRVSLHTLGCKLNYAETSAIGDRFARNGFELTEFGTASDVIVINSCTVTENADRECRQLVRRALRANPDAFVVVTGCYAQLQPEEIASIDGVDLVLGSAEKFHIERHADGFVKRDVPKVVVGDIGAEEGFGPAATGAEDARTRAFLKVQDGCDYNCAFCTIPLARGGSRSRPIAETVAGARRLVADGFREIVVTGVNVGDFGRRTGESFHDLLVALHEVEGLERLRVSSIEPNLLTPAIIELAARSDRMVPHFHVPLQSGSDAVLGRMRRRYRSALYRERADMIVREMPDAAIGVDVIVGFPGETDAHFEETFAFLHELPAAYFHVFTYSERENTPAAAFGEVVPVNVRRERTRRLRALSELKRSAFAARFTGQVRPVLFEHGDESGGALAMGFTDNYVRVGVPYHEALPNRIVRVRLGEFGGEHSAGEIMDDLAAFVPTGPEGLRLPVLNVIAS